MRLTLYEIETTTRKASVGAGLPHGLGEDIGVAAAWLTGQNYDGVEAALNSIRTGMSKAEMSVDDKGIMVFSNASIAVCGPSVIDLLTGEKSCIEVHLHKPDSVVLLFGFAGVAASQRGCIFRFDFSNGTKVQVSSGKVVENGEVPGSSSDVVVRCYEDKQGLSISQIPLGGVEVNIETWSELAALAARTYVPESNASRAAGAGAGLTDND